MDTFLPSLAEVSARESFHTVCTFYPLNAVTSLLSENAFNTNQSDQLIANLVALFPWQFRLQLFYKNQELQDLVKVVTR